MSDFNIERRTIYKVRHGSHAYGCNVEGSDEDFKGVAIAPIEFYLSPFKSFEQSEKMANKGHPNDEVIYEIKKFINLLSNNNPNIIEVLFADESDVVKITQCGKKLLDVRDSFITKQCFNSFSGYSISQFKRIKTHRSWLLKPLIKKPEREDFGLSQVTKVTSSEMGAYDSLLNSGEILPDSVMEILNREKKYASAKREWDQYQNWKNTRNEKRAELEAKYGYDCYVEETEFLTKNGFKKFDEISEDDELATVILPENCPKHKKPFSLEYQKYTDKFDSLYSGPIYNLFGNHLDVKVTANHRILFEKEERNTGKKYNWKLDEISKLPDTFNILRQITPNKKNYKIPFELSNIKNFNIKTDAYLRLIGWYVSDGTCSFNTSNKVKSIYISQIAGGKLSQSLTKFSKKYPNLSSLYVYKKSPNEFNPRVHTEMKLSLKREISERLYLDCSHREEKRIPRWAFDLSKSQMEKILDAAIMGDGTKSRSDNGIVYYSKSKNLASDIQELALLCGFESSLYGPYFYENQQRKYNCEMYQVAINKTRSQFDKCIRSKNLKKEDVKNKRTVCFSVPNSTLVTRLNGHIAIQGNCKHAYHLIRLSRMAQEILEGRGVIVKRPDREELIAIRSGAWTYDQLEEQFQKQDAINKIAFENSKLPEKIDFDVAEKLCINLILNFN